MEVEPIPENSAIDTDQEGEASPFLHEDILDVAKATKQRTDLVITFSRVPFSNCGVVRDGW